VQVTRRSLALVIAPGVLAATVLSGSDVTVGTVSKEQIALVPKASAVATSTQPAKPAPVIAVRPKLAVGARSAPRPITQRLVDPSVVGAFATLGGYALVGSAGGLYAFPGGSVQRMPSGSSVAAAMPAPGGYRLVGTDGGVFAFGARFYGSAAGMALGAPIVAAVTDPATGGYWLAGSDGGVLAFHAGYYGSASRVRLAAPVVAMAATPTGRGYWLVARDGAVFAFGDARYLGRRSGGEVVAAAATPGGQGYWLASADGSVAGFGAARVYGSNQLRLAAPVAAMAAAPDGRGYWLAGRDGGVFAFGSASYLGAARAQPPAVPAPPRPTPIRTPAVARPVPPVPLARPEVPKGHGVRAQSLPKPHHGLTEYAPGSIGIDISQYQCGNVPTSPQAISVVQVTDGTLNGPPNPCYAAEAEWAGPRLSTYLFMDGLPNPAPPESMNGRAGRCTPNEGGCQAYNYGWFWSRYWVTYSRHLGIKPALWWLDIESGANWTDPVINDLVIQGAVDGLKSERVQVGFYSTPYQWAGIAGSLTFPGVAVWTAGAGNLTGPGATAAAYCASGAQAFAGGRLALVQWGYQGNFAGTYTGPPFPYDLDYACP
jgi:hypothetical protein